MSLSSHTSRQTIAVIYGGPSPEHDVSVLSAQQLMDAVDVRQYHVLPVYLDWEGRFYTSESFRDPAKHAPAPKGGERVQFGWGPDGPILEYANGTPDRRIDAAVPVLHGAFGEDGRLQGLLEMVGIPTTGFSAQSSAIAMRKDATKDLVKRYGVNTLPHVTIDMAALTTIRETGELPEGFPDFPVVIKPANLGSSIGVGLAKNLDEARELLWRVLKQDWIAIVEPQVRNLVEYNVAMINVEGETRFSAIEMPKSGEELLDYKEKYLSSGGGTKGAYSPSQGMLSLTRDINPDLSDMMINRIYDYADKAFTALGRRGAPRIDFLCDRETGEIWFNEINAIPGSYGYFLWEQAETPLLFPELVHHLVTEAQATSLKSFTDPVPQAAHLLRRR